MTTATLPRLASRRPFGLFRLISNVVGGVLEARDIATRYDRLQRMSNAELAGLGLSRQDIPSAAVNGVAGL